MAIFSQSELNKLIFDINKIITDTSVNTTIKYRQFVGEDYYNPQDQYVKECYIDWPNISAIKGTVTLDGADKIGDIQLGDTKFVFMQSSVSISESGTSVSVSDVIVDFGSNESGVTYELVRLGYDPLGIVNICYGRIV